MKRVYRIVRRYYNDYRLSRSFAVKLFNYQLHSLSNYSLASNLPIENHWLHQFVSNRISIPNRNSLSIFGVNGDKAAININRSNYKIFYTIENVHVEMSPWIKYEDLLLNHKKIDLSLGFDYIDCSQYLRFPFWLMTMFSPNENYKSIKAKCKKINGIKVDFNSRNKFCSFICREDYFGDREFFADEVSKIDFLNCPGKYRHNDDDLKQNFNDHKLTYLSQFKFNLCPENSNNQGYVTEKIFDSIAAGCIPIYWGSNNNPEPDIINQNTICFLTLNDNNEKTLKKIKEINENPRLYADFMNQDKLSINAPEIIYDYFLRLENRLKEIVK